MTPELEDPVPEGALAPVSEVALAASEVVSPEEGPSVAESQPIVAATPRLSPRRRWRIIVRIVRDVLHDVAVAVLVVVLFVTFVAQAFRVQGTSMLPLVEDGERIVVYKLGYRLGPMERGQVVVFWYPLDPSVSFIKRVVGLPGERLEIHKGALFVNGRAITEPYLQARFRDEEDLGPIDVRARPLLRPRRSPQRQQRQPHLGRRPREATSTARPSSASGRPARTGVIR